MTAQRENVPGTTARERLLQAEMPGSWKQPLLSFAFGAIIGAVGLAVLVLGIARFRQIGVLGLIGSILSAFFFFAASRHMFWEITAFSKLQAKVRGPNPKFKVVTAMRWMCIDALLILAGFSVYPFLGALRSVFTTFRAWAFGN